jgi:hypothetical protein
VGNRDERKWPERPDQGLHAARIGLVVESFAEPHPADEGDCESEQNQERSPATAPGRRKAAPVDRHGV